MIFGAEFVLRFARAPATLLVLGCLIVPACGAGVAAAAADRAAAAADTAAAPRVLCHLADKRIDEASGIAVGVTSPGVVYVQNDSGDVNRFFAVNVRTGVTAATVTVTGAANVDWEDIAVAPDAEGVSSVWLADIGDNDASRREVEIYRVAEPRVDAAAPDRSVRTARAQVWRLRYPGRYPGAAVNAESLAVTPHGEAYVITKSVVGASAVYRVPPRPDRYRVQTLHRVGSIRFVPRVSGGAFGIAEGLLATSASISLGGTLLAVRTYTDAYVWTVRHDDVAAALRTRPEHFELPAQAQGEGIAFDGDRLLVDSEGRHTAVDSVPIPAGRPVVAASAPAGQDQHMPVASKHSALTVSLWVLAALVVLAVLAAVVGRFLIKRGRREPLLIRLINRASDGVVDAIKRPLTIAVLDEVSEVLRTGHYTRNLASALQENREEIKQMVSEKIKDDPAAGAINLIPFHDRLIAQVTDTTLRVILEVLADPRTDELVSDMLRDNLTQIRQAVRERSTD